jgi:hypothetical protein
MAGMRFTPQVHGKFNFANIANFIGQFVSMREQSLSGNQGASEEAPRREAKPSKPKDTGPAPELNAGTFEAECVKKGGLCAIGLLDGAPENGNKQAHLDMLTKLRAKKAGSPLSVSWIDATCHLGFLAAFGLSEADLPTMVILSPSKLKWARSIGAFDLETLSVFGSSVASGRTRTDPISELPPIEDVDCSTMVRGGEVFEEETPLDDDTLAEILEEERKEREAREAELASSTTETTKVEVKDSGSLSEIEKLERDLEDCTAEDLLCEARNSKVLKVIEKKRALEEKLKKIAKKKKKAKKKAKAS